MSIHPRSNAARSGGADRLGAGRGGQPLPRPDGATATGIDAFMQAEGLRERLRAWAHECGFSQIGITGIDLADAEPGLVAWLQAGFHGHMDYMARHGLKRARPAELVPGTVSVISARMDYLPHHLPHDLPHDLPDDAAAVASDEARADAQAVAGAPAAWAAQERARLAQPSEAVVSLYARGRDYHKVLRQRLQRLADRLAAEVGPLGHRVFTDSAPVLEVELAVRAGLAWRGKHTLALARDAGSMFFLGEIFLDRALPPDVPPTAKPAEHCGTCRACLDACPTGAIVAPYRLDARRCISYLTIELHGPIPPELRAAIGNRIYGCDDCQLVCPWNKYARRSALPDFDVRAGFGSGSTLLALWAWSEAEFLRRTEGSAIRRIGYSRWRRNLAVAMGNALREAARAGREALAQEFVAALGGARGAADDLGREHIDWALAQLKPPRPGATPPAPAATPPSPAAWTP